MSDPKKNFVCVKCGNVTNDKYREWGKETPCDRCIRIEFENKLIKKAKATTV